jgi:UDPglucose 6-dehydrogenase
MARICVVGQWHQGTVLAGCFADMGHDVVGVDTDPAVIEGLSAGRPPLHEPGLPELIEAGLNAGRLRFTTDFADALAGAELVYLSLDTPVGADDRPEMEPVLAAARAVGQSAPEGEDVVLCVTAQVPVGATYALAAAVEAELGAGRCQAAYIPEFLRLGTAIESFRDADRFIIGADDDALAERLASLYRPLGRPVVVMDVASAEMTKHASNAFLATSISFINEMADLCEEVGADVTRVAEAMKLDARIGPRAFLSPGLGFAGGTLGRDLRAIQELGAGTGRATTLTDAVLAVNRNRAGLVTSLMARLHGAAGVEAAVGVAGGAAGVGALEGVRATLLGLTYKAGTSTLRRSVALEIARELAAMGVEVRAFDPHADLSELDDEPPFQVCHSAADAVDGADAVVVTTAWPEFRDLDLAALRDRVRRPALVDTQNLFDPVAVAASGWSYYGVGRRAAPAGQLEEEVAR